MACLRSDPQETEPARKPQQLRPVESRNRPDGLLTVEFERYMFTVAGLIATFLRLIATSLGKEETIRG